jgi:hypothetical protein
MVDKLDPTPPSLVRTQTPLLPLPTYNGGDSIETLYFLSSIPSRTDRSIINFGYPSAASYLSGGGE